MLRILAVALFFLSAAAPALGQCSEADKKKLEEFDRAWGEATRRGDRAALQEIFANDYMNLAPVGPQTKSQAIDNAVRDAERQRAGTQPAPDVTYDMYMIQCTPNTATITHRNTIKTTRDGKEQTTYSRSVHVLEKRGGRWQVVSNAGHPLNDAAILLFMEQEWADADRRNDVSWFERNFADNFTTVSADTGALRSKAEEITQLRSRKEVIEDVELSDMNVRMEGETGVVTGVARVKGRDEQNKTFDRQFRFTDVFVKRDGRWLVLATQLTAIQS